MPAPIIHDEKPAARTNRDGLDFVRTTTASCLGKDNDHGYIRPSRAPIKAH